MIIKKDLQIIVKSSPNSIHMEIDDVLVYVKTLSASNKTQLWVNPMYEGLRETFDNLCYSQRIKFLELAREEANTENEGIQKVRFEASMAAENFCKWLTSKGYGWLSNFNQDDHSSYFVIIHTF